MEGGICGRELLVGAPDLWCAGSLVRRILTVFVTYTDLYE